MPGVSHIPTALDGDIWGHHTKSKKIVRLGLLRKPIAFRKPIAIPLCNAKYGAFLKLEHVCNNLRLRNKAGELPDREFRAAIATQWQPL